MAEGLNIIDKFTLVNAPAGSGKTTAVSHSIKNILKNPTRKILCITYTNRASEQLRVKIPNENVEIGTIHSFIGNYMRPFFKIKEIIEYFVEFYEEKLLVILNSNDEKDINRRLKYLEKYNLKEDSKINKDTVIKNIVYLEYGETQFTSFLYGKLSHDDLLIFSKAVFEKFPKLSKTISQKYSYIFIDEYQDTNSEILELFYYASLFNETKLVLLGDEMQQIYQDKVGDFHEVISRDFVRNRTLENNWRSQEDIVNLLNNLYYDFSYQQYPQKVPSGKPMVHIVENLRDIDIHQDTLQLVLYNSELFSSIGSFNLYKAYDKRYKIFDKYSAKDILSNMTMDNTDDLIVLLLFITEITYLFENRKFSELIQKTMDFKFSNKEIWKIKNHKDKIKIEKYLGDLIEKLKTDLSMEELLHFMCENKIIDTAYVNTVLEQIDEEEEFKEKINLVKYNEFVNCYNEMKNPKFSTQHAVKGEGYDCVALKVSDGSNPNVKMYFFLELFSKDIFNYEELNQTNREIKEIIKTFNNFTKKKISDLKAPDFTNYEHQCKLCISNIKRSLSSNDRLFQEFFSIEFSVFEKKLNITAFKKCITLVNKIEGALLAYKLFYVGCSRAKEKLDVYVTYSDIQSFYDDFEFKMKSIGFEVDMEKTSLVTA